MCCSSRQQPLRPRGAHETNATTFPIFIQSHALTDASKLVAPADFMRPCRDERSNGTPNTGATGPRLWSSGPPGPVPRVACATLGGALIARPKPIASAQADDCPPKQNGKKRRRWTGSHPNVFPWGDDWDAEKCNHLNDRNPAGGGMERLQSAPVGSYPEGASPWGCMDMVGNAYEWVADWYKSYPGAEREGPLLCPLVIMAAYSWIVANRVYSNRSLFRSDDFR